MKKPAILLITCDELRRDSLGLYGNRAVTTPHIDALAASGTRYDNAYTSSPLCLPARCSILTGLYPHNSRAYSNFKDCAISPDLPNLFGLLKQSGYRTAMAGKCHFLPVDYDGAVPDRTLPCDLKDQYLRLGIDDLALLDGKSVAVWFYDDYSRELDAAGILDEYRRLTWDKKTHGSVFDFPGPAEWHPDAWIGRKSAEYIGAYEAEDPLFFWASFSGPHYPFDGPVEYQNKVDAAAMGARSFLDGEFDDPARVHHASFHGPGGIDASNRAPGAACKNFDEDYWTRLQIRYHAMVKQLDDQIGALIDGARKRFGENLLILFTADHGELLGDHGLWGKNNCAYEPVWRVPMTVSYPGEPSRVSDAKVSTLDILPTVLTAAGLGVPEGLDGRDLRLSEQDGGHRFIFAEAGGFAAVTDGVYKYVHVMQGGQEFRELYDLSSDPGEFHSFLDSPAHQTVLAEMQNQMIRHFMKDALI